MFPDRFVKLFKEIEKDNAEIGYDDRGNISWEQFHGIYDRMKSMQSNKDLNKRERKLLRDLSLCVDYIICNAYVISREETSVV